MKKYYPPSHTAEHILNRTMVNFFNCGRSFSSHIEKMKSKCDYRGFTRNLTDDELRQIELQVNNVIEQNLDITEKYIDREEAENTFNLERLPEDAGEKLRIVSVGNYDSCPCIGDHVNNTREIGKFKIISSSFNDGILRIRFKVIPNEN
jgi:misacylated tRNA(Ala) deacylase